MVTQTVTYVYDPFNNLVGETVNGVTSHFVFDPQTGSMVLDLSDSGTVNERMLWGPGVNQILAQENSSNVVTWALTDNQGTVRNLASTIPAATAVPDHGDRGPPGLFGLRPTAIGALHGPALRLYRGVLRRRNELAVDPGWLVQPESPAVDEPGVARHRAGCQPVPLRWQRADEHQLVDGNVRGANTPATYSDGGCSVIAVDRAVAYINSLVSSASNGGGVGLAGGGCGGTVLVAAPAQSTASTSKSLWKQGTLPKPAPSPEARQQAGVAGQIHRRRRGKGSPGWRVSKPRASAAATPSGTQGVPPRVQTVVLARLPGLTDEQKRYKSDILNNNLKKASRKLANAEDNFAEQVAKVQLEPAT